MNDLLEAEINDLHANICAGLAEPKRIMILYSLAERPQTVNDLAAAIGMPQSSTSRHLRVLRERGMVHATRQAQSVEYRLGDGRLIQALDLLRGVLRDHISHRAGLIDQLDLTAEVAEEAQP
ncbi:MAG: metalloregulator ArsR/SmtB family transcription factor [Anaerolineales bacterium]